VDDFVSATLWLLGRMSGQPNRGESCADNGGHAPGDPSHTLHPRGSTLLIRVAPNDELDAAIASDSIVSLLKSLVQA
jgi:hypothetical protein